MPEDGVSVNGDKFLGQVLKSATFKITFPRTGYWSVRLCIGLFIIKIGVLFTGMKVVVSHDDGKSDQA